MFCIPRDAHFSVARLGGGKYGYRVGFGSRYDYYAIACSCTTNEVGERLEAGVFL